MISDLIGNICDFLKIGYSNKIFCERLYKLVDKYNLKGDSYSLRFFYNEYPLMNFNRWPVVNSFRIEFYKYHIFRGFGTVILEQTRPTIIATANSPSKLNYSYNTIIIPKRYIFKHNLERDCRRIEENIKDFLWMYKQYKIEDKKLSVERIFT